MVGLSCHTGIPPKPCVTPIGREALGLHSIPKAPLRYTLYISGKIAIMMGKGRTMPKAAISAEDTIRPISLRLRDETRSLIDRAATMLGRTRTDFMIEASRKAAEDAILDQTLITVDREKYDAFVAMLDRPAQPNERLRATMRATPLWERK